MSSDGDETCSLDKNSVPFLVLSCLGKDTEQAEHGLIYLSSFPSLLEAWRSGARHLTSHA